MFQLILERVKYKVQLFASVEILSSASQDLCTVCKDGFSHWDLHRRKITKAKPRSPIPAISQFLMFVLKHKKSEPALKCISQFWLWKAKRWQPRYVVTMRLTTARTNTWPLSIVYFSLQCNWNKLFETCGPDQEKLPTFTDIWYCILQCRYPHAVYTHVNQHSHCVFMEFGDWIVTIW